MRLSDEFAELETLARRVSACSDSAAVNAFRDAASRFCYLKLDDLRQALRDSERVDYIDSGDAVLYISVDGERALSFDESDLNTVHFGATYRAAIDAAMGRREGEVGTFKVCRCHTADARRLCPDKRECMTAEAHATTPEDAD